MYMCWGGEAPGRSPQSVKQGEAGDIGPIVVRCRIGYVILRSADRWGV